MTGSDASNGYDAIAAAFIEARSDAGSGIVKDWAAQFPKGARVLDLGCGHGVPNMPLLLGAGLTVSAIDASPSLLAEFRARFPQVETACEPVEQSAFFGRQFDGVLAVGLMFLLPVTEQLRLIQNVSDALKPRGRFLFTAPQETGTWEDLLTKRRSQSLGAQAYTVRLLDVGFAEVDSVPDPGASHFYRARKA